MYGGAVNRSTATHCAWTAFSQPGVHATWHQLRAADSRQAPFNCCQLVASLASLPLLSPRLWAMHIAGACGWHTA